LNILACPACKAEVRLEEQRIACIECGRKYLICDGIPVMLIDKEYYKDSKDFFDARFSQHIFATKNAYKKRYYFALSRLNIKPQDMIVEIGCAQGGALLVCKQKGIKACGIDFSIEALKIAKRLGLNNLICADAQRIPLRSNLFDKVIVLQILEILGDKKSALDEIKRIAKADTQFYFEVRNGSFVFRKLSNFIRSMFNRVAKSDTPNSLIRNDPLYDDWIALFGEHGYKIEKTFKSPVYLYYENPSKFLKTVIIKIVHYLCPARLCFTVSFLCRL